MDENGLRSYIWPGVDGGQGTVCLRAHILARPDSIMDGNLVYSGRKAMGAQLAREHPVDADVVIGIPTRPRPPE